MGKGIIGYEYVRPGLADEIVLAYQLTTPFTQNLEHPIGLRPEEPLRAGSILQAAARTVQHKIAEANPVSIIHTGLRSRSSCIL
jgi:hypothetical protein